MSATVLPSGPPTLHLSVLLLNGECDEESGATQHSLENTHTNTQHIDINTLDQSTVSEEQRAARVSQLEDPFLLFNSFHVIIWTFLGFSILVVLCLWYFANHNYLTHLYSVITHDRAESAAFWQSVTTETEYWFYFLYSNVQRILFFCSLSISCCEFTLGKHFVHVHIPLIAPPETWCLLPSGVSVHAGRLPVCVCGVVGCCVSLPWLVSGFISSARKLWGVLNQSLLSKRKKGRTEKNMRRCKSKEAAELMEPFQKSSELQCR